MSEKWTVLAVNGADDIERHEVVAENAVVAGMEAATKLSPGFDVILIERHRRPWEDKPPTTDAPKLVAEPMKGLPRIYVWADKNTDKMRPGFVAHAIAQDGTVIIHRIIHGQTLDWVRKDMWEGDEARAAYREAYPRSSMLVWVEKPTHDYGVIAARLASEGAYSFQQMQDDPRATRMTSARTGKIAGYVVHEESLGTFYATQSLLNKNKKPNADTKQFPNPAAAAEYLHRNFTEE